MDWETRIKKTKQKKQLKKSNASGKIPNGGVLLQGNFTPFFTNIDDLSKIRTASFIFKMKIFTSFNDITQDSGVSKCIFPLL